MIASWAAWLCVLGYFSVFLALIGILNSAISLYYYARILKAMYFRQSEAASAPLSVPTVHRATALAMAVPTLILGIYWAPVMDTIKRTLSVWG